MDDNECNNQLRPTLHDVFGLEDGDNLNGNEDSYGGYAEGPDRYLDTDDEDLQNLADEETNRSHQSAQDEDLSVFDGKEDDYGEDDVEEEEGPMHDDSYTDEQYTAGPIEGMSFRYVQTTFAFYKEHSRLTGFGVVKKSEKLGWKLSRTVKRSLIAHDIAGLRPSKSIRLLEVKAGGTKRMRCTAKDCCNYILQQWRLRILFSDAAALHRFFTEIQSKAAYRNFSYVICFDIAYLVNQWRMPFAFFIGVNHHNQSILLGCALLTSEDIKTYAFVFRTWLMAMDKIPPIAILTDQCESIKAVIREVLPNTIHKYCIWLIFTKLPRKA
ncbi:protein FAR1-RELATED SEQUENCE 5-like [Capsicum annuum]|uniref:protein FAR1-RELATED SEQUENCE 5-like n=1 Tax=Capsicum annuum TaxID=4072 RepID=UPI001FB0E1DB|nr:protein FAR1-RELATED SEQUENCE 5-like [Capsicum annuum]